MNREETKKAIEVMQAYVDGAEISCRVSALANKDSWETEEPEWNFQEFDYRKKPEPIECWVTVRSGTRPSTVHATEELANNCVHPELNNGWTVHKVVIE